ncbi:hypothetical protein [Butyrivibrio sp.]|uniref:hypothetical protein n=1 Tax=Butyrivibrio sp. TaxID=28121 RepID=UPI0025BD86CA|nr:hypothetical protein [Butyrivibrio sp.]MBE5838443.1 hypothetical protein [Butyrivibrio sp.]
MAEKWYRLRQIPDLTLNKYSSLEGKGVDGVLENHIAFLRQLNRKGIVSGLSYHLYYFYLVPDDKEKDAPGNRLQIYLMIHGNQEALGNVDALIKASPLYDFYKFESGLKESRTGKNDCSINNVLEEAKIDAPVFNMCAFLSKSETLLPAVNGESEDYYMLREWEMNEDGRLYTMCNMMEALGHTSLYRVDLYPVEKSVSLREALRKPMSILRRRQDDRGIGSKRDYDGKDVLDSYEDLIEKYDSSPHFIANVMVFANEKEDAISILDAAGSESLKKGKYIISTFASKYDVHSFIDDNFDSLSNMREGMIVKKGKTGLIVCREDTSSISLNYLPTLFSLEEIAPFFRFPALYDGETIQMPKETAPAFVSHEGSLFLGKDSNGYDVYFPLSLLPKHAFVSGVPGSGKTNTMHHITSSLWKKHRIPFLVLEPAKQEYRALINDPEMSDMYLFSPNADMSFPLHINPFEMPKGTLVAEHINRLRSVFEGAFPLEPPMPFLLDTAIEAVYRELGWIPEHVYMGDEKLDDGETKRRLPTMSMLYRRLEQELKSTQYSDEVRGNLESALKVRIGSLLRREMGDVFDVPESSFAPEKWLEVPAVIELESMGTGPANFLTLMLCALIRETLKVNPRYEGDVRHVIFIEEAHNLIGPESEEQTGAEADPKQAATAFVVKMLAEVRALKEGIVIADQLPTVMAQEVLKNTGLKIGLRITSSDDRSLLGSTMAASALQLEQMSTFAVGEALIFYEKLMRPFKMRIKEWCGEIENDAEKALVVASKNDNDLRSALADSETYRDENLKSIKIIGNKYYFQLVDIEDQIKQSEYWLTSVKKQVDKINDIYSYLERVELGRVKISDEEKNSKYDLLEDLQASRNNLLKEKEKIRKVIEIISTIGNWVFALERLKCGRWARFNAPESELIKITLLQIKMCDEVFPLNEMLRQALGTIKGIEKIDKDLEKLSLLYTDLDADLNKYVELYGVESITRD